jgi:DeoR/GlpR family transcriptional regulator of sugar metabolism
MTPAQLRRGEILRTLDADGGVRVASLAARFGVSEVTIRSDLTILTRHGRPPVTLPGSGAVSMCSLTA